MLRIKREYRWLNFIIVGLFVIFDCNLCAPPGSRESAEETANAVQILTASSRNSSFTPTQTQTPSQTPVPVSSTSTSKLISQAAQPQLTVTVNVGQAGYSKASDVVVYTYTVKNTGQAAVNGPFELVDKKADQWTCDLVDSLPVGDQLICKGYYRVREDDLCSSVANVAYVKGIFQGKPVISDPVSVTVYSGRNCNRPYYNNSDSGQPPASCQFTCP